jgi:autotransporter-associated beta strand protein
VNLGTSFFNTRETPMQTTLILERVTWKCFILALVFVGGATVKGATIYWDKPANAGSNWGTIANWSTASNATTPDPVAAPGSADLAVFSITVTGGGGTNVNLGNGATQSALGISMTTTATTSFRGGDAGNPLASSTLNLGASGILKTGSGGSSIGSATAGSNITINLVADQTWENNSTAGLRVDGPVMVPADVTNTARILTIGGTNASAVNSFTGLAGVLSDGSGSGNTLAVVKTGTGIWTLASTTVTGLGQHTFSGGLTVSQGTLSVNGESSTGGVTSGPLGTGVLTMNGGTLLGSNTTVAATGTTNSLGNNITLNAVAGSTFSVVNGTGVGATSTTTLSGVLSGPGGFTKTGSGALVLTNVNSYGGDTTVNAGGTTGVLRLVNGSSTNNIANSPTVTVNGILDVTGLQSGAIALSPEQILKGTGAVLGVVAGAGTVAPGASPGILAAAATDPTGGLDYSFEMTAIGDPNWSAASASVNDVLRLTSATPITAALSSGNTVAVNFAVALNLGDVVRGGFFTDVDSDFAALLSSADWQYTFAGGSLPGGASIVPSVTQVASANFASGTVANGWVSTFTVVPEPSAVVLMVFSVLGLAIAVRRSSWSLKQS